MSSSSKEAHLPDVCIAVLNWNGQQYLEHLIPSLLAARANYAGRCRILVLDNLSSADDLKWVRTTFPSVETVASPANDFLYSYNWLLARLVESVVVLLNNDLKVEADFLEPLVSPFVDPAVFAVGARSLEWDGTAVTSAAYRMAMHHGWAYSDGFESQEPVYTSFAVGGFMAVDRLKFHQLGGFDRLYHPAYGEDSDICLRAWARGWTSVYQPHSTVWHREGASWDGEKALKRAYLMTRSQFLFNSRNCRGMGDRIRRMIYLKILAGQKKKSGDLTWLAAIREARAIWSKIGRKAVSGSVDSGSIRNTLQMVGCPWIYPPSRG